MCLPQTDLKQGTRGQRRVQAIFGGGPTEKFADKISKICRQIMKDLPTEFFHFIEYFNY